MGRQSQPPRKGPMHGNDMVRSGMGIPEHKINNVMPTQMGNDGLNDLSNMI
jgi:hypothetical protein